MPNITTKINKLLKKIFSGHCCFTFPWEVLGVFNPRKINAMDEIKTLEGNWDFCMTKILLSPV